MLRMSLSLQWFKVGIEYTCLQRHAVEINKMEKRHMQNVSDEENEKGGCLPPPRNMLVNPYAYYM